MAQIPSGLLTRGQILNHALRMVGNTKTSVRDRAAEALNQLLFELATQYEWPFFCISTSVALSGGSFALPSNFLVSQDDSALSVIQSGSSGSPVLRVAEVDRETLVLQPATDAAVPLLWHPDRANGLGLLWPTVTGTSVVGSLRYRKLPTALTDDAQVPEFPWHRLLIQGVYVWGLEYDSDPRSPQESVRFEQMLDRIRQTSSPLKSQSSVVPLDPDTFGSPLDDTLGW